MNADDPFDPQAIDIRHPMLRQVMTLQEKHRSAVARREQAQEESAEARAAVKRAGHAPTGSEYGPSRLHPKLLDAKGHLAGATMALNEARRAFGQASLTYEERFTENPKAVRGVSERLRARHGLPPTAGDSSRCFAFHGRHNLADTVATVRGPMGKLAQRLADLGSYLADIGPLTEEQSRALYTCHAEAHAIWLALGHLEKQMRAIPIPPYPGDEVPDAEDA